MAVERGSEVGDGVHLGYVVGVNLDLELILKLKDHRDEIKRIEGELLEEERMGLDWGALCPGRDATDRFGDGGENIGSEGAGGA